MLVLPDASGIWEGGEHRGRIEVVEKSTFHGVKTLYPIADKRNLLINPSCYQHLFMSHLVKQLPWKKVERNPWIRQICQICWICTPHRLMYSQNCCVCVCRPMASANGICAAISFTVCRKTTLEILKGMFSRALAASSMFSSLQISGTVLGMESRQNCH